MGFIDVLVKIAIASVGMAAALEIGPRILGGGLFLVVLCLALSVGGYAYMRQADA